MGQTTASLDWEFYGDLVEHLNLDCLLESQLVMTDEKHWETLEMVPPLLPVVRPAASLVWATWWLRALVRGLHWLTGVQKIL